ncbi:CRISPR associated protein [compost metagenome]
MWQEGYCQQRLKRKGNCIEFSTLDYQGMAQVADPERLGKALLEGVGHSRGFGCGLLLVKRV